MLQAYFEIGGHVWPNRGGQCRFVRIHVGPMVLSIHPWATLDDGMGRICVATGVEARFVNQTELTPPKPGRAGREMPLARLKRWLTRYVGRPKIRLAYPYYMRTIKNGEVRCTF